MASNGIPQIDIAPMLAGDPVGKRRIAEQVREALETIGFFTIVGHGVPEVVVHDARDVAYEFFALPLAEKMRIPRPSKVSTRGYDPPANQRLAATHGNDTPPDLQEIFGIRGVGTTNGSVSTRNGDGGQQVALSARNLWPKLSPPAAMYARSSIVLSRPSTAFRCGNRPKRATMLRWRVQPLMLLST